MSVKIVLKFLLEVLYAHGKPGLQRAGENMTTDKTGIWEGWKYFDTNTQD